MVIWSLCWSALRFNNDKEMSFCGILVLLFVSFCSLVGFLIIYRSARTTTLMYGQQLISVPRWPFIGNLIEMLPEKSVQSLITWTEKYGKFVEIYIFSKRIILISDLSIAKEVLTSRPKIFRRIRGMEYFSQKIGIDRGLFMSHGQDWSRIRRFTVPSFNRQNIQHHISGIWELAVQWTTRLEQQFCVTNAICDFRLETFTYTLDVMTKVAFSTKSLSDFGYFTSSKFAQDTLSVFAFAMAHASYAFPQWTWPYSSQFKFEQIAASANERMTAAAQQLIRQKKLEMHQQEFLTKESISSCSFNATNTSYSLIETMLRREETNLRGNRPTNVTAALEEEVELDILGNIKTFYIAGSETTAVTIAFAIFFLAQNLELYQKLQAEADQFIENHCCAENIQHFIDTVKIHDTDIQENGNRDIVHFLSQLKYCEAVMKETLRLGSPANIMMYERENDSDPKPHILSNGIKVRSNDQVLIYLDGLLSDPVFFPDPLRFDPNRWLNSSEKQLDQMEQAFLAFGYGPRVCPGMSLAFIEGIFALTNIAHSFDISLACDPSEVKRMIVFTASPNKVPIWLKARR